MAHVPRNPSYINKSARGIVLVALLLVFSAVTHVFATERGDDSNDYEAVAATAAAGTNYRAGRRVAALQGTSTIRDARAPKTAATRTTTPTAAISTSPTNAGCETPRSGDECSCGYLAHHHSRPAAALDASYGRCSSCRVSHCDRCYCDYHRYVPGADRVRVSTVDVSAPGDSIVVGVTHRPVDAQRCTAEAVQAAVNYTVGGATCANRGLSRIDLRTRATAHITLTDKSRVTLEHETGPGVLDAEGMAVIIDPSAMDDPCDAVVSGSVFVHAPADGVCLRLVYHWGRPILPDDPSERIYFAPETFDRLIGAGEGEEQETVECDELDRLSSDVADVVNWIEGVDGCGKTLNASLGNVDFASAIRDGWANYTWGIADKCGNRREILRTVKIVDTRAPRIRGVSDVPRLWCSVDDPRTRRALSDSVVGAWAEDTCTPREAMPVQWSANLHPQDATVAVVEWSAADAAGNVGRVTREIPLVDTSRRYEIDFSVCVREFVPRRGVAAPPTRVEVRDLTRALERLLTPSDCDASATQHRIRARLTNCVYAGSDPAVRQLFATVEGGIHAYCHVDPDNDVLYLRPTRNAPVATYDIEFALVNGKGRELAQYVFTVNVPTVDNWNTQQVCITSASLGHLAVKATFVEAETPENNNTRVAGVPLHKINDYARLFGLSPE
jgi:hypothetical protein